MAKCDLRIELEDDVASFFPGDEVVGAVVVTTDDAMRCDGLTVELRWETHGRGSSTSGDDQKEELFAGEWAGPVTEQRYPFRFTLPAGPVSYYGHHLNVGWFLRARADVPWKLDPKAEREITLTSGADERRADWRRQYTNERWIPAHVLDPEDGTAEGSEAVAAAGADPAVVDRSNPLGTAFAKIREKPGSAAVTCGCLLFILVLVGGFGSLLVAGAVQGLDGLRQGDLGSGIVGILAGGLLLFIVLGLIYQIVRWRLLKGRLGDVQLTLDPLVVGPGKPLAVRLSFTPNKEVSVESASAKLRCYERVVSGSGTNRSTRIHEVLSETFQISGPQRFRARQPVLLDGELTIPADAAPSFRATDNRLTWEVEARLDIPRFPDWSEEVEVVVRP